MHSWRSAKDIHLNMVGRTSCSVGYAATPASSSSWSSVSSARRGLTGMTRWTVVSELKCTITSTPDPTVTPTCAALPVDHAPVARRTLHLSMPSPLQPPGDSVDLGRSYVPPLSGIALHVSIREHSQARRDNWLPVKAGYPGQSIQFGAITGSLHRLPKLRGLPTELHRARPDP